MRAMIKWAAVAAFALCWAAPSFAADVTATVTKITGKAQLQSGSDWKALSVGQVIPVGATVSTGFRSELQLKIGPSVVTVKALSRLTVKDLVTTGSDVKTDLYLKVGKIDAEVNKDEQVKTNKFTVSSPVATASVRGTAFTFDGVNLFVTRGLVSFADVAGNKVNVPVGEQAQVSETGGDMTTNEDFIAEDSTTSWNSGSDWGTDGWSDQQWTDFFDSVDMDALLAYLEGYDWSSEVRTHVYIHGIVP